MKSLVKFASIALLFCTTACTGDGNFVGERQLADVERLRTATFVGSPFTQALAKEYRDFSVREQDDMYDYPDALHFARKGLYAARGTIVTPEPVSDWDLEDEQILEFVESRSRLMRFLDVGARDYHPVLAARAQAKFDCWIEQQEENWQNDDIQSCKNGFLYAMADLENVLSAGPLGSDIIAKREHPSFPLESLVPITEESVEQNDSETTNEQAKSDIPESASEPLKPESAKFLAFFEFDSAKLDQSGQDVVSAVSNEIQKNDGLNNISIIGHADTTGSEKYNQSLGLRRAKAAKEALIKLGVDKADITISSKGEKELLVDTKDNVREPANRRVEFIFE